MSLPNRVLQRYKSAANKALSDTEYARVADKAFHALDQASNTLDEPLEDLLDMGLTLKDRGKHQEASTLMDMSQEFRTTLNSLTALVKRLHKLPPAKSKPKTDKPENPWTKPLGR